MQEFVEQKLYNTIVGLRNITLSSDISTVFHFQTVGDLLVVRHLTDLRIHSSAVQLKWNPTD